jgi:hypothetical protein
MDMDSLRAYHQGQLLWARATVADWVLLLSNTMPARNAFKDQRDHARSHGTPTTEAYRNAEIQYKCILDMLAAALTEVERVAYGASASNQDMVEQSTYYTLPDEPTPARAFRFAEGDLLRDGPQCRIRKAADVGAGTQGSAR